MREKVIKKSGEKREVKKWRKTWSKKWRKRFLSAKHPATPRQRSEASVLALMFPSKNRSTHRIER